MCILPTARTGALTSTRTRALTRKHTRKYTHTHTHTARLFQEAADKGDDWGLNNLGSMLLNGLGGFCVYICLSLSLSLSLCVCVCV